MKDRKFGFIDINEEPQIPFLFEGISEIRED